MQPVGWFNNNNELYTVGFRKPTLSQVAPRTLADRLPQQRQRVPHDNGIGVPESRVASVDNSTRLCSTFSYFGEILNASSDYLKLSILSADSLDGLPNLLAFALSLILWLQNLGPTSVHNLNRTPISSINLSHSVFYLVLLYSTACRELAKICSFFATCFTSTTTINQPPPKQEPILHLPPELICITQMLGHECFPPTTQLVRINYLSMVPAIKALTFPFYILLGGNLAQKAKKEREG
eukprot:Gb_19119 [translate_table: standard]